MIDRTFREPTESSETQENAPLRVVDIKSDELAGFETKLEEPTKSEEETLDIWEGLHSRKFGEDYFNIREISHTFPIKAEFGYIDKMIKAEMTEKGLEMNTKNYQDFLAEIEREIGTDKLDSFKRINRIFQYLKTLSKFKEIRAKKEAFKSLL